jgi:hypothetical protein
MFFLFIIMNEIFIILKNQYSFINLIFKDFINEFYFYDKKYNFTFINKKCLKIYDSNQSYLLSTNDSFIFYDSEIKLQDFKIIDLIHDEWFDQSILYLKEKKIIRIKDRDQYGQFKFLDNQDLKIHWNFWGEEIFNKKKNNTYIHELSTHFISQKTLCLNNNFNDVNIVVFIHACLNDEGVIILNDQLNKLKTSPLYQYINSINVCVLGDLKKIKMNDQKIKIIHLSEEHHYYELLTINYIKEFCIQQTVDYYILYIHTKGVNKSGNTDCIQSWRYMMEYFLIDQFQICLNALIYHQLNTVGNNILNSKCIEEHSDLIHVNKEHCYHYSGNFWWAKSSYLKNLNYIQIHSDKELRSIQRFQAENWLLSKKQINKHGILYQNNTNIHPYHLYMFENYLNKFIYLKII